MSFHKVMVGNEVFGCGTFAECSNIIRMHKSTKNGHKQDSKSSQLDFKIVEVAGDYPSQELQKFPLGYKQGRVPATGEIR